MKNNEKKIYFATREEWRQWLQKNYDKETGVWLVYPKKNSCRPRIPYNDAVEEALCFNWIDSIVKSLDEESSMQRFSPRNPKSGFSQLNKERLKWLLENGMMHPDFEELARDVVSEEYVIPDYIIEELKKDEEVWNNYQNFSDSYKRIRIAYIDSARVRPDIFEKRLAHFIKKTKANKLIKSYGGSEKYY